MPAPSHREPADWYLHQPESQEEEEEVPDEPRAPKKQKPRPKLFEVLQASDMLSDMAVG
jgi:hypothetical protein